MLTAEKQQKPGQWQHQASDAITLSKYTCTFTPKAGTFQAQTTGVPKRHRRDVLLGTDLSLLLKSQNADLNNQGTNRSP